MQTIDHASVQLCDARCVPASRNTNSSARCLGSFASELLECTLFQVHFSKSGASDCNHPAREPVPGPAVNTHLDDVQQEARADHAGCRHHDGVHGPVRRQACSLRATGAAVAAQAGRIGGGMGAHDATKRKSCSRNGKRNGMLMAMKYNVYSI